MLEDTRIVREGLGSLLMKCDIEYDNIAMLYSMPSTHIAHFDGNTTYGHQKRDHRLWYESIHNAGLQFNYVTDRMLRLGEFDTSKYKVLILPLAFAMGEKEADVIKEFVKGGGTVIADLKPATYDEHCKPLEKGYLDDLFGITRDGKQDATEVDRLEIKGEINGQKAFLKWGNWHGKDVYPRMTIDPTVQLSTGRETGKAFPVHYWWGLNTPLCVVNEHGKGRAILLNFSIYNAPADDLIKNILLSAGVKPQISITKPDGTEIKKLEITRWKNGDSEIMCLFGKYDGEVKVKLNGTYHVNELKNREYIGNVTEFNTKVIPNRASFFALMQKVVPELTLSGPKKSLRGSTTQLNVSVKGAEGLHAVQLSLINPGGDKVYWFKQTHNISANGKSISIPFALNDKLGTWQIEALDVLTSKIKTFSISLESN
jgi:hypothetical protein